MAAVLVHEHFHAAVASGLDALGLPAPTARDLDEWKRADALNESLAAWVERHYFREHREMADYIRVYIRRSE